MGYLLAAISLGFLGSFHCIGMCGPIALALPIHSNSYLKKLASVTLYNIGRASTYTAFGVLFGSIGKGFAIFGLQQIVSIVLGILILLSILLPNFLSKYKWSTKIYNLFFSFKGTIASFFAKKGYHSLYTIGLLNGLLPCGLVYMAVAGSVATGDSLQGGLFMAAFGLGTIPVMVGLSLFGNMITSHFRSKIRTATPYIISMMAILMILRGLNLGIPYVSPKMQGDGTTASCHTEKKSCCHKK